MITPQKALETKKSENHIIDDELKTIEEYIEKKFFHMGAELIIPALEKVVELNLVSFIINAMKINGWKCSLETKKNTNYTSYFWKVCADNNTNDMRDADCHYHD
jgi:hypothetical protein